MDILGFLLDGFAIAFQPLNLGLIVFGCAVGLFIGAMPGLGSVNGVAILLPMTFLVPPTSAIIFLGAIYYGAMYGGAISSIMLGIPGASTAVATTFDGRPLALKGLADRALVGAATASFVGGTISVVLFTFFAPPLADVALKFGAPEEFAREDFGALLLEAYAVTNPTNTVVQAAVFHESHAREDHRAHYHAAVLTQRVHRWGTVVQYLRDRGVFVHASDTHGGYHTAYRYCALPSARKPRAELDPTPWHTESHPTPAAAMHRPRTARASAAKHAGGGAESAAQKPPRQTKRVRAHMAVVALKLDSCAKLQAHAKAEAEEGRTDMLDFVHSCRDVRAFIATCFQIESADVQVGRDARTKLEILHEAARSAACECGGVWAGMAEEVLTQNDIEPVAFKRAVLRALEHGPEKSTNVFLHGPTNCGKSFLLNPLLGLYRCFKKPQKGSSYAMSGLEECEAVLWHEFEHDEKVLSWSDMLLWLEGEEWNIGKSKSFADRDLPYNPKGTPVFMTAARPLHHRDHLLHGMMEERFHYFALTRSMSAARTRKVAKCGRCFAEYILGGEVRGVGGAALFRAAFFRAALFRAPCVAL